MTYTRSAPQIRGLEQYFEGARSPRRGMDACCVVIVMDVHECINDSALR
eukprot:COSAG01_NODE_2298_length_7966_cov_53.072455_5_plen_49_part_00